MLPDPQGHVNKDYSRCNGASYNKGDLAGRVNKDYSRCNGASYNKGDLAGRVNKDYSRCNGASYNKGDLASQVYTGGGTDIFGNCRFDKYKMNSHNSIIFIEKGLQQFLN
ncbi:MAG: hypothetical protein HY738_17595 [Bacteroidia bacterium]|nr:hypothetical protein [Bacteroidia bacterium]